MNKSEWMECARTHKQTNIVALDEWMSEWINKYNINTSLNGKLYLWIVNYCSHCLYVWDTVVVFW